MKSEVRLLKALADENRLRLLRLLSGQELFVCQLMAITGLSQPLVSRGLSLLEREGLVESRRQGKHVFYRLSDPMPALGSAVLGALTQPGRGRPFAKDRQALDLFLRRFHKKESCDMNTVRDFIAFRGQNQ